MSHYDNVRYAEEARREGYTKEELRKLEEEAKKKDVIVYDDYEGMKKVMMAKDSDILSSSGSGSIYTIKYDPDKIKRLAKDKLNYEPRKPIRTTRYRW